MQSNVTRRNFNKLTIAALGGAAVGATAMTSLYGADDDKKKKKHPLLTEPHVCCGLNTCKAKDPSKKNACAGQGSCHTAKKHVCKGMNVCAGQSGCGNNPGENACKGKGACAVPLGKDVWKKARKNFEAVAKEAKIKVGKAPKGCPK